MTGLLSAPPARRSDLGSDDPSSPSAAGPCARSVAGACADSAAGNRRLVAKRGLAANTVDAVNTAIVLGVEEGIVPLPRGDLSEERRLLYVAMTRATDMCVLTYAQRRTGPTARIGTPRVGRTRSRTPLHANLPGTTGQPVFGAGFSSSWPVRAEHQVAGCRDPSPSVAGYRLEE